MMLFCLSLIVEIGTGHRVCADSWVSVWVLRVSDFSIMENFRGCLSSLSSSLSNQNPLSIGAECWLIAEQITQEILSAIQPTAVSEQRRMEVIDYVQRLIRGYCGTEVFSFGSVPLKTYLPDGDIDLTAVSHQNVEAELARNICSILKSEEQEDAEFLVKDVQYIPAQLERHEIRLIEFLLHSASVLVMTVKIVKCTVQHIAVDISFNQMAGLCSLCFLEQVNQLIGKDHLFKRSIILIKAWCYYESRTLGAHHGLISTYALETLILYIINLFHNSLQSPLEVLYRFLDYYSTFDWDKYCVSINGPVVKHSLPEVVVETLESNGGELLLKKEFLENCIEYFSIPTQAFETKEPLFAVKHLNIIDPLKFNNNLGRSVSKGNLHRIRSAFSYGARKLRGILMRPGKCMGAELKKFFVTTLNRNGRGQRPDVQDHVSVYGAGISDITDLCGDHDSYFSGLYHGQWYHNYTLPVLAHFSSPTSSSLVRNSIQFNQNDFFPRQTDSVPIPFCHLNAFQPLNTALGIEEMANFHGTSTCIPPMSIREFKPRGTGTYIPDIGVEEKLKSRGTGTFFPDVCVEEKSILQGTCIYIPEMGVEEKLTLQDSGTCIPEMGVEENLRLGGTETNSPEMGMEEQATTQGPDTCIPDTSVEEKAHHAYKKMHVWEGERNPEPKARGFLQKASPNIEQVELSLESDKNKNSRCFDLSLEEFPLLPSSKKAVQPTTESPEARKASPCEKSVEFGNFGHSPEPLARTSPMANKPPDFGVSTTVDSMFGFLTIATQGPQKSSECKEETDLVQPYQLKNDEDFPALC